MANFYEDQASKRKFERLGIMTAITNTYVYNITCKVCESLRTALVTAFVAIVAMGGK